MSFFGVNNGVLVNFVGNLDPSGKATVQLAVPNVPIPQGLALHLQPFTLAVGAPDPIATFGNVVSVLF